jgi:hypothetical protein
LAEDFLTTNLRNVDSKNVEKYRASMPDRLADQTSEKIALHFRSARCSEKKGTDYLVEGVEADRRPSAIGVT